jgi:hypothetical protein
MLAMPGTCDYACRSEYALNNKQYERRSGALSM